MFESMSLKLDKDYHAMIGLSRRLKYPKNIELDTAKRLKVGMQERVMELWH